MDDERLIEALILANNAKLMQSFLDDILTEQEFKTLIKRLKTA